MNDRANDLPDIPGFELERRLGSGGMAEVFLAKKRGAEGTFKQLVLKRILPEHSKSRRFRHMFVEEAHLATRLNHPNIVQVYEFSHHGEELLLSMEYVEGVDLGKLARAADKKQQRVPPWVSAFVIAEVAKGLHYAHERKDEVGMPLAIVHRDVSPQNVLVSYGGVVKIADFGIASANLFREEQGVLKGKTGYMSPEQARGEKVDRKSDIYALGVVLFEMLYGRSPYGALKDEALAEVVRQAAVKAPLDASVPPDLAAIVMRAVSREPSGRYHTAREMAAAIGRALLENREFVDNAAIEETLARFVGDGSADGEPAQRTLAAVRKRTAHDSSVVGTAGQSQRIVREVRHVAVVKLRLDGFDALGQLSGPAAAAREIASTRATLDDIAYKRGTVWSWESDRAAHAVVGLLAAPARASDDTALCAVDVHEFLASRSEDLPVQLRAAIAIVRGIATGERDQAGHLVHHVLQPPASYLADELGARTPFGKTWVAGGVYRLVRRGFRWSEGPTLVLDDAAKRNAPERMRVYALLRPLTSDERSAETALNPNDLVGRDAEKADLHAAYHRAVYHPGVSTPPPPDSVGGPQTRSGGELLARVIVGEMGIGKTALVETFVAELPDETRVFRVECSPNQMDLPYATVADLMHEVTGIDKDAKQADAEEAIRALMKAKKVGRGDRVVERLAQLVTGAQVSLQDEDAAAQHHELTVRGVRLLIGVLAEQTPVVIVVDGLQWADRMSLELLGRVLRKAENSPILTLLCTRPDERVEPYLEGMMRSELSGLSADDQVRLVQARLGVRRGVADVCRELVPRVGGNPYFLLEMVDALLERGALEIVEPREGGEPQLLRDEARFDQQADTLPSTVEQLVADRLNELPRAEHDVVDWLAVAGGPLSEADLMSLTRLADDEAITRLCARGLCDRRGNALDFRHPLARDVAYGTLDVVQRARMHRRLGEQLSTTSLAQGLSAAIVAQHLERGEAPRQAAELYLEAANAARSAHQTQLALRYFQRTIDLLPAGDDRLLVAHDALVRIYRHIGQPLDRRRHLDALRRLALESRDARWVATALTRTAELDADEGGLTRGVPIAQRAAEVAVTANTPDLEVEALIVLCELLRDVGDVTGALEACERALKVASTRAVSRRARGEVLRAKGVLLRWAGRPQAAVEAHAEAIAIFHVEGARRSEARAKNALGFALFVLGRYQDCIAMCLQSLGIDMIIGGRFQVAKTLSNIGVGYARLGEVERGLTYLARAREAHERYDDHDARVDTLLVSAGVLVEHRRLDEAKLFLGDASALLAVGGRIYDRIHCHIVQALLARHENNARAAAFAAAEARKLAEGQALLSYHVYATAIEAVARVDLGEHHAGVLLATTALGAVEAMEGCEYGVEVRSLCCEAVIKALAAERGGSAAAMTGDVCRRALDHVDRIAGYIRDARLRESFYERPPVRAIVDHATRLGPHGSSRGVDV
jgi:eukaryotic-like serine/threonine-protein kinase